MSTTKKTTFYGRPVYPVAEKLRVLMLSEVSDEKKAAIEDTLKILDGKPYISAKLVEKLVLHLAQVLQGFHIQFAENLVGKRFGYGGFSGMKKSHGTEEYHKERAKSPSIRAQIEGDMRSQYTISKALKEEQKECQKAARRLLIGDIGGPQRPHHKTFFFYRETQYVEAIEKLLSEYNDCYLQAGVSNYPQKIQMDEYNKSFGLFWKEVVKLHTSGVIDLSVPGLLLIKKLSHYLYSWNFRRYMDGKIISRYAPFLPEAYRAAHVAAKRDTCARIIVDDNYYEMEFEEEPDDNIGNR